MATPKVPDSRKDEREKERETANLSKCLVRSVRFELIFKVDFPESGNNILILKFGTA